MAKAGTGKSLDTGLFIDGLFSSRETVCELRLGPQENTVRARAKISVCDNEDDSKVDTVLVNWEMGRDHFVDGQFTRGETECDGTSFHLDEAEVWVTALYRAVQFAKKQGYLPSGKES